MKLIYRRLGAAELTSEMLVQAKRIYVASFPPCEREPFSDLTREIRDGRATLYGALGDVTILGFGVTLALPIKGTAYLAYLAVASEWRGQGIGGHLFRAILEDLAARCGSEALVWEVERPGAGAPPDDPKRLRIAFYQRQGGVLLDQVRDFQMPDLSGPGTLPAGLMWVSLSPRVALTRSETLALVAAVYRVGYGRDLTDPLVRHVLTTVEAETDDP